MTDPGTVPAATERAYTVDALTESLGARISGGDFEVGSWIRQARIAEEYGVSRTPVSLALSRLEGIGVVERVANRGFRVRIPSTREVLEVIEVRRLLEGQAAYLAASRIGADDLKQLFRAVELIRKVANLSRKDDSSSDELRKLWHEGNTLFHETIFESAGNRQLRETAQMLYHRLPRNISWKAMGGDPRLLAQNAHEHEDLAIAIDLRDADRARELAVAHMTSAQDIMLTRLDSPPG